MSIQSRRIGFGRNIVCLLVWGVLAACSASAQDGVRIGTALGYEFGVPLAVQREPGLVNRFNNEGRGISYNHTLWGGTSLLFPGIGGGALSPEVRFALALSMGRFVSNPYLSDSLFDPITLEPATNEFEVYSNLSFLQLDLPFRYRLGNAWSVGLGPWFNYRLTSSFIQSERIISPDSLYFPATDSLRERTILAGDSLGGGRLRYGALLSLAHAIPIAGRTTFVPELYARLDIPALADKLGVRAFSAGLGLSIYFQPGESDTLSSPPPPPDTGTVPPLANTRPQLRASVDLYSETSDSIAVIRMQSTLHRHSMPLVPLVRFARGSSDIPESYHALTTQQADSFTRSALARLSPADLYSHTLNIIGMRMRSQPGTTVVLRGAVAGDEPSGLAQARAERVRGYLGSVWGIDRSRMEVASGPAPASRGDIRGVTIGSSSAAVMAPVVSEWILQDWYAPRIGLSRSILADAGVRSWEVVVRQGREVLARYSSGENQEDDELDGVFPMRHAGSGGALEPIIAELVVHDMAGGSDTVRDRLAVVREEPPGGSEVKPTREVLSFTFPEIEGGEAIGRELLMRRIPASVRDDARIVVTDMAANAPDTQGPASGWSAGRVAGELLEMLQSQGKRVAEVRINSAAHDSGRSRNAPAIPGVRVLVEQEVEGGRE